MTDRKLQQMDEEATTAKMEDDFVEEEEEDDNFSGKRKGWCIFHTDLLGANFKLELSVAGNTLTAACHIITAVIGAGVLALPYSVANFGWGGGPPMLLMFGAISLYSSMLLADVYRYPGPDKGRRNRTYMACVRSFLGSKQVWLCGAVQYLVLVILCVGYNVVASISMAAIRRSDCFHGGYSCKPDLWRYCVIFGACQIVFSQIPDLSQATALSVVAAIMSITYASIGLGLSIGKATEHTHSHGTADGVHISSVGPAAKAYYIFASLGQTAFAFIYSFVLVEVQDTLGGPAGSEARKMKRANWIGIFVTTFYYVCIGCIGYAAFGNDAPSNLLTGFGFYNPWWLLDLANLCVVIHIIGTWQVIAQPFFAFVEGAIHNQFPRSRFLHAGVNIPLWGGRIFRLRLLSLVWRTAFVCFTTVMAALFPFFNDIVGIIGSLGFWPLTVHFPFEMHIAQKKLPASSPKAILLRSLDVFFFIIAVCGIIGNVYGLTQDTKGWTAFGNGYTG